MLEGNDEFSLFQMAGFVLTFGWRSLMGYWVSLRLMEMNKIKEVS